MTPAALLLQASSNSLPLSSPFAGKPIGLGGYLETQGTRFFFFHKAATSNNTPVSER